VWLPGKESQGVETAGTARHRVSVRFEALLTKDSKGFLVIDIEDMACPSIATVSPILSGLSTSSSLTDGRKTERLVPFSGSLSTYTAPPNCETIPCTTESPSPVPWPTFFVEKYGSKIFFMASAVIPSPVSLTVNLTY